jgi:hypothetical protein
VVAFHAKMLTLIPAAAEDAKEDARIDTPKGRLVLRLLVGCGVELGHSNFSI